jgi:hypothetical protein
MADDRSSDADWLTLARLAARGNIGPDDLNGTGLNQILLARDGSSDTLNGSEGNDVLVGGSGNNTLNGGGGNDLILSGLGADAIEAGPGADIVFGTLEELSGDRIVDFSSADALVVHGPFFGIKWVGSLDGDDVGLSLPGTNYSVDLLGFREAFSGGDFMTVARGAGPNAYTMMAFEPFLPNLSEGVRVDPASINGIINEPFLTGDGTVRFSMELKSAMSAFNNTLGTYKVAADGTIHDVHVLFSNTLDVPPGARTVDLGTPGDGESIGFFLIQNGSSVYGALPADLSLEGNAATLRSATLGMLDKTPIFHSIATLNPDGANHVLSGVAPSGLAMLIGFEDLPTASGDNDFQDIVISVRALYEDNLI